jgi:LEA14-like dessication related protein
MKIKLIFLLILVCVIGTSCTPLKPPVSVFNKYEIEGITFAKADILFYFDIENPNDIPLGIKDITYSVDLDGSNVTMGTYEGFQLNGRDKKLVVFPVELTYAKLMGQAINLAKKFITRDGNVKYSVKGELSVVDNIGMSAKVPLAAEGDIKLF